MGNFPERAVEGSALRSVLRRPHSDRERIAAELADRMDGPVTVLGIIFFLLVIADAFTISNVAVRNVFTIASWSIWAVFVAEFAVRMVVAPSTTEFLKRNWWQVVFLAVPFLRFARVLARLRVGRMGRVVSSAVRSTRTAARALTSRIAWLGSVTVIVVLSSSHLLYEFGGYDEYGEALRASAHAAVNGEPLSGDSGVAQVLSVVLSVYAGVVFAALAGMLGAFFIEGRRAEVGGPPADRG